MIATFLQVRVFNVSIHDNGLIIAWYPFTGFFGSAGHMNSSVINVVNYHHYL